MFERLSTVFSSRVLFTWVSTLCVLNGVRGRVIDVDWTPSGVMPFSSLRNPLRTQLGDQLILRCQQNVSNLFIQREQVQYDGCDANLGSGMFDFNGFCLPGDLLQLTLSQNSQMLTNTVNFLNNTVYFLTSYYNGQLANANDAFINSGGQCLDGLRMIFVIGEFTLPAGTISASIPPTQRPGPGGVSVVGGNTDVNGNNLSILYTIIPAVAGSIIVIVTAVILTLLLIKVCYVKAKTKIHNDPLSHQNFQCVIDPPNQDKALYTLVPAEDQSPQHRLGMITTPSSGTLPNVYVDSRRLPSPRPSSKHSNFSRQSDTSRHNGTSQESSSRTSSSEVTVNQLNHIPHVHVGTRPTTYNHGMELPVASSRGRAMRPAPRPPVSDYENVAESDLPQFQSTNEQWSSRPVTYRPTSAWKQ